MSDNPYAPPKTPVVDSDPALVPMERPNEIMAAIWLAFINYGLGVVVVLLSWDYYSKLQTLGGFLGSQAFSLAILCWLYTWNEFLFALILTAQNTPILTVVMAQFVHELGMEWHLMSATAVLALGPALIVTVFGQKYVIRGLKV